MSVLGHWESFTELMEAGEGSCVLEHTTLSILSDPGLHTYDISM